MIKRLVTMVTSACLTMAGLVTVTTLAVPAAASTATTRSASQAASILAGTARRVVLLEALSLSSVLL